MEAANYLRRQGLAAASNKCGRRPIRSRQLRPQFGPILRPGLIGRSRSQWILSAAAASAQLKDAAAAGRLAGSQPSTVIIRAKRAMALAKSVRPAGSPNAATFCSLLSCGAMKAAPVQIGAPMDLFSGPLARLGRKLTAGGRQLAAKPQTRLAWRTELPRRNQQSIRVALSLHYLAV